MINLVFRNILHFFVTSLQWLSVIVIIYGVIIQFTGFMKSEITCKDRKLAVEKVIVLKNFLGTYILFALEILIGADIIESILDPSINHILSLAALVIIRTIISYFLNKEIESKDKNS
ncbi:MAG: DUF1622 domain-containing protein [Clostridium sp.]